MDWALCAFENPPGRLSRAGDQQVLAIAHTLLSPPSFCVPTRRFFNTTNTHCGLLSAGCGSAYRRWKVREPDRALPSRGPPTMHRDNIPRPGCPDPLTGPCSSVLSSSKVPTTPQGLIGANGLPAPTLPSIAHVRAGENLPETQYFLQMPTLMLAVLGPQ